MKYTFILNPISGNRDISFLKEEIRRCMKNLNYEIFESEKPKHSVELAQKAVKNGTDIVIAAGGDGSIIEVVSGIMGSNAKLGVIPYGTGNMLASNLNIPLDIPSAINLIIQGHSQKIDIGQINDKYFAFMAGCGFDARIIEETSREQKKRLGLLAYFIEGFKQVFRTSHGHFIIKIDNKKTIRTKALTVIIANSANIIGNIFSLAPQARLNDGLLDLIIVSPKTRPDYFKLLWHILVKQTSINTRKIRHYQAKEIEIITKHSLPVQADGDVIGTTPIKIKVLPKSIDIITPKQVVEMNMSSILENNHFVKVFNLAVEKLKINLP